jgi:hypothetical protein
VRGAEQVLDAPPPLAGAEERRVDAFLDAAIVAIWSENGPGVDRLRPGELGRRRRRRIALNVIGFAAARQPECSGDATRVVVDLSEPSWRVEAGGRACSDQVGVAQGLDRHRLGQPEHPVRLPGANEPVLGQHGGLEGLQGWIFDPVTGDDRVEHGGPPILRRRAGLDPQHRRRLAPEREAVVVGVPDVGHVDRLGRTVVRVPLLPVEEGVLREGRRARGRHGRDEDERARGESGADPA